MKTINFYHYILAALFNWILITSAISANTHVHGHANASIILDENKLILSLKIPAYDLIGFEHPPQNEQQKTALKSALNSLQNHSQWLKFNPNICSSQQINIISQFSDPVKEDSHSGYYNGHRHDHDNEHKHDQSGDFSHSDFELSIEFICSKPEGLNEIEILVDQLFSRPQTIEVQWLVHNKQGLTIVNNDQKNVLFFD